MTHFNGNSKSDSLFKSSVEGDPNNTTCNRGCFNKTLPKIVKHSKFFLVIMRHIKNGTEKETPWCWCYCFSANTIRSPIRIDPKQVPKSYKSTEVGELLNCFKSDSNENLELHTMKKHFKDEKEGDPDLFYDAVAVNGNEEPEAPPLPAVIDDEVMGRNHGGANELAAALNGVVDIDDDNEPAPEHIPG